MDEINNECTILVPKSRKTIASQGGNPNKSVTFSFNRAYNSRTTTAQLYNELPYSLVQVLVHSRCRLMSGTVNTLPLYYRVCWKVIMPRLWPMAKRDQANHLPCKKIPNTSG